MNTGWEEMSGAETLAQRNAARQQRKIIGALMGARDGEPDMRVINLPDVEVSSSTREEFLDKIRSGEIGQDEEKMLLTGILSPVQKYGAEYIRGRMGKHELRILGAMTGGSNGFNRWMELGARDLEKFVGIYETPMDFENRSAKFLEEIGDLNGRKKREEYEAAMSKFKKEVYGKRQEYWERIKALNEEARADKDGEVGDVGERRNLADERRSLSGRLGRKVFGAFYGENGVRRDNFERERSAEWEPGVAAMKQVSRVQVRRGVVNHESVSGGLWADGTCEDAAFAKQDIQMFGVFDGAGGMVGGKAASNTAAATVEQLSSQYKFLNGGHLKWALERANEVVVNNPEAGCTTAVLASVVENGDGKYLAYASAGDSRIYIVDRNGRARQITRDEGAGRYITNALGNKNKMPGDVVEQYGDVKLNPGDRVVMCSDGITGDYGSDLMSNEEIGAIVQNASDAEQAAVDLVAQARKTDDRTVVVFGV